MEGVLITAYDHVGLRVTDAARALSFYADLGFALDEAHSNNHAAETDVIPVLEVGGG
jgi:catechol 2,3-dioxygenase-like lactoylglutathione lyase family enzyme